MLGSTLTSLGTMYRGSRPAQFALLLRIGRPRKSEQFPIRDHNCRFRDSGMAEQRRFQSSQFDAMPVDHHHVIAPAIEHQSLRRISPSRRAASRP